MERNGSTGPDPRHCDRHGNQWPALTGEGCGSGAYVKGTPVRSPVQRDLARAGRSLPAGCEHCGGSTHGGASACKRRRCPGYVDLWMGDQSARLLENLWAYRGQVAMVTITPPGVDRLPWDQSKCSHGPGVPCGGKRGCVVDAGAARDFNESAMTRWSSLWASVRVDCTRKFGPGVVQLLAYGIEPQRRGAIHLHVCLGAASKRERNAMRYAARLLTRRAGAHGWGFVDDRPVFKQLRNAGAAATYLSKYLTKGAAAEGTRALLTSGQAPARCYYVTNRLTSQTRATMRNLRSRRYVYVRIRRRVECDEVEGWLRQLRLEDLWRERHNTLRAGSWWAATLTDADARLA